MTLELGELNTTNAMYCSLLSGKLGNVAIIHQKKIFTMRMFALGVWVMESIRSKRKNVVPGACNNENTPLNMINQMSQILS